MRNHHTLMPNKIAYLVVYFTYVMRKLSVRSYAESILVARLAGFFLGILPRLLTIVARMGLLSPWAISLAGATDSDFCNMLCGKLSLFGSAPITSRNSGTVDVFKSVVVEL